jgi:hypothetical protein
MIRPCLGSIVCFSVDQHLISILLIKAKYGGSYVAQDALYPQMTEPNNWSRVIKLPTQWYLHGLIGVIWMYGILHNWLTELELNAPLWKTMYSNDWMLVSFTGCLVTRLHFDVTVYFIVTLNSISLSFLHQQIKLHVFSSKIKLNWIKVQNVHLWWFYHHHYNFKLYILYMCSHFKH